MDEIFTIGGYGHTQNAFFSALVRQGVDVLVDVRQRRGMRGPAYTFLNSAALQAELARQNIAYRHLKELAPTASIRAVQKSNDMEEGTKKRDREQLSDQFVSLYSRDILDDIDITEVVRRLVTFKRPCFFCVEASPYACHRSLTAQWLADHMDCSVRHL